MHYSSEYLFENGLRMHKRRGNKDRISFCTHDHDSIHDNTFNFNNNGNFYFGKAPAVHIQSFDRSYIIASSHDDDNENGGDHMFDDFIDAADDVKVTKTEDQEKIEEESNFVVEVVSNFFSSYKHISENQAEFFLFVGLAVAMGLALFLAMLVWGMYRSNRLTRIKNRLRRPNTAMTMTSSVDASAGGTTSEVIDAYIHSSPLTGSPVNSCNGNPCPPGAVDLEEAVGDHEVDAAFRTNDPEPLIVTSSPSKQLNDVSLVPSSVMKRYTTDPSSDGGFAGNESFTYGTITRQNRLNRPPMCHDGSTSLIPLGGRPRSQRLGSDASSSIILNPALGSAGGLEMMSPFQIQQTLQSGDDSQNIYNAGSLAGIGGQVPTSEVWTPVTTALGDASPDTDLSQVHPLSGSQITPFGQMTPDHRDSPVNNPYIPSSMPIMRYSTIGRPRRAGIQAGYQHTCHQQPGPNPYNPHSHEFLMHPPYHVHVGYPIVQPNMLRPPNLEQSELASPARSVVIVAPNDPSPPPPPHPLDNIHSDDSGIPSSHCTDTAMNGVHLSNQNGSCQMSFEDKSRNESTSFYG